MQEMEILEKLYESCKYNEDRLIYSTFWEMLDESLNKSCLYYYFLGTVRSNQVITTSQMTLYFTEK